MKKSELKTSFSEIKIDNVENKFSFINRVSKKILQNSKDMKGQPGLDEYLAVLSEMIPKEKKKDDK